MAMVEGRSLTSSDPCVSIVHGLLRLRKGDENDPFPKKAIESLVRKLKEKRDELDSLIQAVTSCGEIPSKCVTIPRTLDGRLQVATRKGFPHVVYARIWRWPDVHKNEMKHLRFCQFAFDLKRDGICINPYHYERIVPAGIDLAGLSIHQMAGMEGYGLSDDAFSPYQRRSSAGDVLSPGADSSDVQDNYSDSYTPQQDPRVALLTANQHAVLIKQQSVPDSSSTWVNPQCSPTTSWVDDCAPGLLRQSPIKIEPSLGVGVATTSSDAAAAAVAGFSEMPSASFHSQQPVDVRSIFAAAAAVPPPESVAYLAGTVAATDFWRNIVTSSDANVSSPLSSRPLPEIWCSITYFELDDRVGEIFKVPLSCPIVTVDGYTNPSSPDRFCLGKLTNVQRTETTEKARLHIGKGVQLVLEGEGDVWVRCLSDHSIFVQSYYLDRESGRQPGDAVHKIYPAAFIKVFDLNQCYSQMRQWAAMSQSAPNSTATNAMGIGADDLRSLCVLRLSFVKGWGPDYPRPTIKDTPCWVEIQLHRPLQLLDEVLQMLASKPPDTAAVAPGQPFIVQRA